MERLWWRLDKVLTLDDVYWSAMVGMIDCIRNGVTTIFDHHASPGAVPGSLFRIAEAAHRDRPARMPLLRGLGSRRRRSCRAGYRGEPRVSSALQAIRTAISSAASSACTPPLPWATKRWRAVAKLLRISTPASTCTRLKQPPTWIHCLREHGKRVVERWRDLGILGSRTLAAHCVHVDDREIDLLRETKTNVVHNPESNMGNAVGCAPVLEMMRRGVRVGLGTDGYTADMFESLKVANLLQKHCSGDPGAGWAEPPQMLFRENAAIASECFGRPVGKLVPGALADIILVNYDPPTPLHAANLNGHILFGLSGGAVTTTIIGGQVVMEDGKLSPSTKKKSWLKPELRPRSCGSAFRVPMAVEYSPP